MEAKELREFIDGVARNLPEALLENKGFEKLMYSIIQISSYLKSEQDERFKLDRKMNEHQELMNRHQEQMGEFNKLIWGDKTDIQKYPGMAHDWVEAKKQRARMEKLIVGVLVVLIPTMLMGLVQFWIKIK